ncbi:MAG TPA: hypothetical protein VLH56_06155, partial [Dissulfurispiraceae bacterium]|nr:hypothetical protein [Dissulfurispiraceae bacterium]
ASCSSGLSSRLCRPNRSPMIAWFRSQANVDFWGTTHSVHLSQVNTPFIDNRLHLGQIDSNTYPVWWLDSFEFSGDLALDKAAGRIIPLQAILSGDGGPDLNKHFNLYYLHWWSLAHFLMQCDNGTCRAGLARLLGDVVTPEAFEKHLGRIEETEPRWYAYLLKLRENLAGQTTPSVKLKSDGAS